MPTSITIDTLIKYAWVLVLSKLVSSDVACGMVVPGRRTVDLAAVIGSTVFTALARVKLAVDVTV